MRGSIHQPRPISPAQLQPDVGRVLQAADVFRQSERVQVLAATMTQADAEQVLRCQQFVEPRLVAVLHARTGVELHDAVRTAGQVRLIARDQRRQ